MVPFWVSAEAKAAARARLALRKQQLPPAFSHPIQASHDAVNSEKSPTEGQGDAYIDAVGSGTTFQIRQAPLLRLTAHRGLDNAGKTTIVKKIMNEDVNSVSPTLGFIIKTIEYEG